MLSYDFVFSMYDVLLCPLCYERYLVLNLTEYTSTSKTNMYIIKTNPSNQVQTQAALRRGRIQTVSPKVFTKSEAVCVG